jgi:predicted nuclease of restriction endonuclease-like RecB superfamily
MLTGKLVRVRIARDRIVPIYLNAEDPSWLDVAERLLELFRGSGGRTRGELDDELQELFGSDPSQLVHQGLAKLLEDRCEFDVVAPHSPEQLREQVFRAASESRRQRAESRWSGPDPAVPGHDPDPAPTSPSTTPPESFDREEVLRSVAEPLNLTPEEVDRGLFADLKSEQRLIRFKELSPERLLQRYNVALAQAVLLRSTRVHLELRGETPRRVRQLLRQLKFHRLMCEIEKVEADCLRLRLDGPLSLFSATQKYGLQLAWFLPTVLECRNFALRADLLWGAQRKPKAFFLTSGERLKAEHAGRGMYVPEEIGMFVELFRQHVTTWELSEETEILPLGNGFWVPDYRLTHLSSGRTVFLEVFGYWRRSNLETHLERLRRHAPQPFLLAISHQLHVEEGELDGLPAGIHRFRQIPQYEEIVRLADAVLAAPESRR